MRPSSSGSTILAYYDPGSLRLVYDVSAANSYAGLYTSLKHANLTGYNAVTFMIKDAISGEEVKIGLRDEGHTARRFDELSARGRPPFETHPGQNWGLTTCHVRVYS